ncbi:hypothetical protein PZ938_00160 [Luteipulveratus sp. YIM 133132]|uniref:hypothetical protein n=1 Tax=Luteipulveratus flavus TaxID=3031728 RepID=UPI0023B1AB9B|nr:hypothetical protein [Luteipulveratus sp. YIM 133132]MDE9364007.1 hypothetical protein [Luteipulveratus sp. YIM 133132]
MAPAGAYSPTQAWRSREHWLTVVVPVTIALDRDRLRGRVSEALLLRYLRLASLYAVDQRTGRCCIVRPDTLASVLAVSARSVQRCRQVARELGLEHVALAGRMLTMPERVEAQRTGSRQRGLSTEVGFVVPRRIPRYLWTVTPSRGRPGEMKSHPATSSPHAARGEMKDAAPPRHRPKGRTDRRAGRLAALLVQIVPWLAAERPRRCAPALHRFATAEPAWSAAELSSALADVVRRRGHQPGRLTADRIRTRPAVVLADLLHDLDPVADHPRSTNMTEPATAPAPHRCDRADCQDGWLGLVLVDQDGHQLIVWPDDRAVPCPDCSPAVRAHRPDEEAAGDDEPRF